MFWDVLGALRVLGGLRGTEGGFVRLEGRLRWWGHRVRVAIPPACPMSPLTHGLTPPGPALLAYNDALMSPRDWAGLLRPGVSHKRGDPSTVGRFGLGFTSVYHLTGEPHWGPPLEPNWGHGLDWGAWN